MEPAGLRHRFSAPVGRVGALDANDDLTVVGVYRDEAPQAFRWVPGGC
ncbi:MAG: hypothetical protein AAF567_05765 [Actinomycetota bacterium]